MTQSPAGRGIGHWLIHGPDLFAAAMLLGLVVSTCVDVFGREVLRAPLKGADELTVVFMALSVYAVFGSVTWREEHVCVDLIDMKWPVAKAGPRHFVLNILSALFLGVVAWRLWFVAGRMWGDGERTEYLHIPKGPLVYFFAIMTAAAALCLLVNAGRYLAGKGPLQGMKSDLAIGKGRID